MRTSVKEQMGWDLARKFMEKVHRAGLDFFDLCEVAEIDDSYGYIGAMLLQAYANIAAERTGMSMEDYLTSARVAYEFALKRKREEVREVT